MKEKKKVSMKQIAERLSVSLGTVSLVLNGRGNEMRISAETQKLILDTAQDMGYPFRKQLTGKRTIAVFLSVYEKVMTPANRIIAGAMSELSVNDLPYDIVLCPFTYDHLKEKYAYLSAEFCSGAVIFALSDLDMEELEKLELEIPVVIYNRVNAKFSSVYVDNYSAGMQAAEVFAQKGFQSVGMVSSLNPNKSSALRMLGYLDGCRKFGIEAEDRYKIECFLSVEGGRAAAKKLCGQSKLPEAIFVTNDDMALGILQEFREKEIEIPKKMSILSYGGNDWNELVTPALSTLRLPIEEMSGACIHLIHTMLMTEEWRPISRIFPLKLEYRQSCIAPEKEA